MLSLVRQVHFVLTPVDMRKSYDGLLVAARHMGLDPYGGQCVVFISRNGRILKAVLGDAKGIYLLCRRFEGGRLQKLRQSLSDPNSLHKISTAQMMLLFEGHTFTLLSEAKDWRGMRT